MRFATEAKSLSCGDVHPKNILQKKFCKESQNTRLLLVKPKFPILNYRLVASNMTAIEISLSGDSICSSSVRARKYDTKRPNMALYDEFAVSTNDPIDLYSMVNKHNRKQQDDDEAFQREHIIQIQDEADDQFDNSYGYGCARWTEAGRRMVRDPFGVVSHFKSMVRENFSSRAMETLSPEEERRQSSRRINFVQH